MEAPLTGGTPTFLNSSGSTFAKPTGVAVDGNHIYWTNQFGFSINEAPLTGGAPTTLVNNQPPPVGVAVGP